MIKAKIFFGILIFVVTNLLSSDSSFSQNRPLTNFEFVKKTVSLIEDKIIYNIPDKTAKISLVIDGDSNVWVFKNSFIEKLNKNNIPFSEIQETENKIVKIFVESKIRYSSLSDDEKFQRDIAVTCSMDFDNKKTSKIYNENYCDTLMISDMQFINNEKIKISSNSLEEGNVFDTLFKPLVILSSTGVLVYLLFTVRSK